VNVRRTKIVSAVLAVALSAAAAAFFASRPAQAAYFTGNICNVSRGQSWVLRDGIYSGGTSTYISARCAVPVDEALSSMAFSFRISRGTSTDQTSCRGYAFDRLGQQTYMSAPASISGSGAALTYVELTPAAGPAGLDTYNYSAACTVRTGDALLRLRLGPA
jgi:hypothetical protein